jgi:hypothetical protein
MVTRALAKPFHPGICTTMEQCGFAMRLRACIASGDSEKIGKPLPSYSDGKFCESLELATGDRKCSLNDGKIPSFRGVRVHVSTGYNRVEGNRRASRNGRVSDLPPELPTVTMIRNLFIAIRHQEWMAAARAGGTSSQPAGGQGEAP